MRILSVLAATGSTILLLSSSAFAQQANCANPQTQTEMNICAGQDFDAADADLNVVYRKARNKMREVDGYLDADLKGAEKALLKGQRAWITYRDGACEAEGFSFRGGSMESLMVSTCKARLTRLRSGDLKDLIESN